jgi:ABC-type transporter Mla subunit MlaD
MADEHHGSTLRLILDATPKLAILLDRIADTTGIERQLRMINRRLDKIMSTQAEVDAQVAAANEKLDALATAIQAEADQVAAAIAALPAGVDTSQFDGVNTRLSAMADSVSNIFTPPAPPEAVE